jgi:hypothetical protein
MHDCYLEYGLRIQYYLYCFYISDVFLIYIRTYNWKHNILTIQGKKLCALADHKFINIKQLNIIY